MMFISLSLFGLTANASPPDAKDDGTNWCDGLDPSSGVYSTCIQAHSAKNRVEHLKSKNASASSVSKAQASLNEAIAQFGELGGGITLPGLSTCPCSGLSASGTIWDSSVVPVSTRLDPQIITIYTSDGNLTAVTKDTGVAYCSISNTIQIVDLSPAEGDACRNELISFML